MTRAAILSEGAGFALAVAVAAFVLTAGPSVAAASMAAGVAVVVLAGWTVVQDLHDLTIPDGAVAGLAAVGLAGRLAAGSAAGVPTHEVLLFVAFDAGLVGGAFLALREAYFRRRGFDGLGLGDVKLAAAGAVLVGATLFSAALLVASLAGLAWAALRPRGPTQEDGTPGKRIAFGAVLAPALAAADLAASTGLVSGPLPGS